MSAGTDEVRDWLRACAAGDASARRSFQEEFAEDIYNFPVRVFGVSADLAADFYVYAFERDRVFSRLATFEGRNQIQLRTFLSFYVLKSIFLEWQRTQHDIDTVSLEAPIGGEEGRKLEDVLAAPATGHETAEPVEDASIELWASLSAEERLDLKLLSLLECDLEPDEVRLLARLSKRPVAATLVVVDEVRDGLARRDVRLAALKVDLDSVWGWIQLRRRELQQTEEKIRLLPSDDSGSRRRLLEKAQRLREKIAKRERQRERLAAEIADFKMTTPYKDIGRLLGLSVGTVCSRIFRLRQRLAGRAGEPASASKGEG